jgi:rRNA maturation protein Nop10
MDEDREEKRYRYRPPYAKIVYGKGSRIYCGNPACKRRLSLKNTSEVCPKCGYIFLSNMTYSEHHWGTETTDGLSEAPEIPPDLREETIRQTQKGQTKKFQNVREKTLKANPEWLQKKGLCQHHLVRFDSGGNCPECGRDNQKVDPSTFGGDYDYPPT